MCIDHREANIVFLSPAGDRAQQIKSDVEKQASALGRFTAERRLWNADGAGLWPAGTRVHGPVANYYEEIFLSAHGADTVFIFGLGEAKGELRKQF